ncbi:hypothetical protein ACLKA7_014733 [Drosophila subpalustris]
MRNGDGPAPFDFGDDGCASEWKKWLRGYDIYAKAMNFTKGTEKLNWMLHYAGPKIQAVFSSLPEDEEEHKTQGPFASGYVFKSNAYTKAVNRLNKFFEPKQNQAFERHVFRQMRQKEKEPFNMFLVRLREQGERCNFQEQTDENICDQIISGCNSDTLRRKVLERGDGDLNKIIRMAQSLESALKEQEYFQKHEVSRADGSREEKICKIFNSRQRFETSFEGTCGRCGGRGHRSADTECPAKGKECYRCGRRDHFSRRCFRKEERNLKRKSPWQNGRLTMAKREREREDVRMVTTEYEDVFWMDFNVAENKIWCSIGGIELEVIIDSGSRHNIVDRESWLELKAKGVRTTSWQNEVDVNFRSYGGYVLKFVGKFAATVKTTKTQTVAEFYVADELGKVLLGYETAKALGVLQIGHGSVTNEINTIKSEVKEIKPLGTIKGLIVDLPIKKDAKGVVQPYRRVPVPLENLVEEKVEEMMKQGIVEKVVGVSKWISPLVCAPKGKDVRICVDMRRANEAVERENHPLPTMEDFLPHLGEAKVFSKLDVKQAYHQVAISPESREITTFMTKKATVSEPLRQLTKKGTSFSWKPEHARAFETLKHSLISDMTLGYYDVKCRTQVIADASPVGLGAVLIQFQNDVERVISYASRSLTSPELKYAQGEKEALALEASIKDKEIQLVKEALQTDKWTDEISMFKVFRNELCFAGNILLRGTRIVIPENLQEQVLQLAHEGHPGMTVMKRRLRAKVCKSTVSSGAIKKNDFTNDAMGAYRN